MKRIEILNPDVRGLFNFTCLQYMLDTICENPKLAKIYVDDENNPETCIVSFNHLQFFGGKLTRECLRFLSDDIITSYIQNNWQALYMIYPDKTWENALKGLFQDRYRQYARSLYKHKSGYIERLECHDNIVEITPELMNSSADNLDMISNEVISTATFDNMEDFFLRGFGYTPVIDNKVCGFCTSEYPSKSAIAIGIAVLEDYQKQGYAKAMAESFLCKAAQRGLTVYWECWKSNIASVNTALSCGFGKVADYPILYIKL